MHTTRSKEKILNRIRRISGQLDAVRRSVEEERSCNEVMHSVAACRGAINGLIVRLIAPHFRGNVHWDAAS